MYNDFQTSLPNDEPTPAPRRVSAGARLALGLRNLWGLLGLYWIAAEISMFGAVVGNSGGTLSRRDLHALALLLGGMALIPLTMILASEIQRRRNVRLLKNGIAVRAIPKALDEKPCG